MSHSRDGIIADYSGNLGLRPFFVSTTALALYNVVEINVVVLTIFKKYNHLYFWSLLVASWGIILYMLAFLFKFLKVANVYFCMATSGVGWWCMVTGQSVVLYSRLHLLLPQDQKILTPIRWMIIINAIVLHLPTTTLAIGANARISPKLIDRFVNGYEIMEKIQLTGFCAQEFIISCVYLASAFRFAKIVENREARKSVRNLLCVNVTLILMDLALLSMEYANLYVVQIPIKGVFYSIKLKLELAVLGQTIRLVHPRLRDLADI